jgi:Glutathione S-transferase, N-terminal domain
MAMRTAVARHRIPCQAVTRVIATATKGTTMTDLPTLYVRHGDDGGPKIHPCRRVQESLRAAGIDYEKVIAADGSPFPFRRKQPRDDLRAATAETKLPALKLPNGRVITHSRAIMRWVREHPSG